MGEESSEPNVQFGSSSAPAAMYAPSDDPQQATSNAGDDTLANLMESMEQFIAEDSSTNHDTNGGSSDQKYETRSLRRSHLTNSLNEVPDTVSHSPEPSVATSTKRAQKKQGNSQALKKAKKAKNDIWTVEYVLQDPKSPLVHANLKGLFSNPKAWDVLDDETKTKLISMLPESKHVLDEVNGETRISEDFLKFDENWGHYLSRAQEDIAEGRNDPVWLEQAAEASKRRAEGEFDDWKDNEYELFWGVKQKLQSNVLTGQASYLKFDDLIIRGLIKPGDIFLFQRTVSGFFIEKEIKFIEIVDSRNKRLIKCTVPPGTSKFSKGDEDIANSEINGPERLCKAAIDADGRLKGKPPNGNSWKTIRVLRNNQDLGTLWDIRQALHFTLQEDDG